MNLQSSLKELVEELSVLRDTHYSIHQELAEEGSNSALMHYGLHSAYAKTVTKLNKILKDK